MGMDTFDDACLMVVVVHRFLGNGNKKARNMTLLDLPCSVCEWHSLITKIGSADRLLVKLPASPVQQSRLRKKLTGGLWHRSYHSSRDLASAKKHGYEWWRQAAELEFSALSALKSEILDCGPVTHCTKCERPLWASWGEADL